MKELNDGMVAYCGKDKEFNSLRVFPPSTLRYPDMLRDPNFFDKIGCPHLRLKYPSEAEQDVIDNQEQEGGEENMRMKKQDTMGLTDIIYAKDYRD